MNNDLIPTHGVHITETFYPVGYLVGMYDPDGLISDQRWFDALDKAKIYAATLAAKAFKVGG